MFISGVSLMYNVNIMYIMHIMHYLNFFLSCSIKNLTLASLSCLLIKKK